MKVMTLQRQTLGWSKAQLARNAQLDQGLISRIESGRFIPYPVELGRLARALGWPESRDPEDLLMEVTHDAE